MSLPGTKHVTRPPLLAAENLVNQDNRTLLCFRDRTFLMVNPARTR
jgi:hypothetical protein